MPAHADVVTQIQQLKELKSLFSGHIFPNINLNAFARTLQVGESRFAHEAIRNDSSGYRNFALFLLQLSARSGGKLADQVRGRIGPAKFSWKCFISKGLNLLQLFLALFELVTRLEFQSELPFLIVCNRSIKAAGG